MVIVWFVISRKRLESGYGLDKGGDGWFGGFDGGFVAEFAESLTADGADGG